ncbi:MAG: Crp/Fnr family transcriptional regulator [Calothrix sp. SM1_5_4]|nr:Crp/Fnr family transcriptional regulator [Calothrix sp. SM1_5_4]
MSLKFLPQIRQLELFKDRSPSEFEALVQGAEEKVLKHRQCLFAAGTPASAFGVVVKGALKLVRPSSEGDNTIVHFATPGDIIAALLMSTPGAEYPVSSIAMGHSIVLKIPRSTYAASWFTNASIQKCFGGNLFTRMSQLQAQKAMVKAPLSRKIATQLVTLIERYSGENENILPIPLTRMEIAESLGASVESVIRVMSDWSRKGYISTTDQVIEILEMDKIIEIVKGSSRTKNGRSGQEQPIELPQFRQR